MIKLDDALTGVQRLAVDEASDFVFDLRRLVEKRR